MKSNAQIFREAADYIREHGWRQGGYINPAGNVCLVGAITVAMGEAIDDPDLLARPWHVSDSSPIRKIKGALGLDYFEEIPVWNDEPVRTEEEVTGLLESLAFDEELTAAARTCTPATPTPETGNLVSQPQLQEVEA